MNIDALKAEVLKAVDEADKRREFAGSDKRNLVAKGLVPKLAHLLPPPWNTIVGLLGGPALETVANIIVHFVRSESKAQKRVEELEAELALKEKPAPKKKGA